MVLTVVEMLLLIVARLYRGNALGYRFGPRCGRGDRMGCGIRAAAPPYFTEQRPKQQIHYVYFTRNGKEVNTSIRCCMSFLLLHGLFFSVFSVARMLPYFSLLYSILRFILIALLNHNNDDPKRVKTLSASSIQYGYRKCEAHARVFSQSFAHGNSKNKIR